MGHGVGRTPLPETDDIRNSTGQEQYDDSRSARLVLLMNVPHRTTLRWRRILFIIVTLLLITLLVIPSIFTSKCQESTDEEHFSTKRAQFCLSSAPQMELLKLFPLNQEGGESFTAYQFNVTLSNQLPLDRALPDSRPIECRHLAFNVHELPTVSVVIPFHNEAWSVLLRALTSILHRSPPELLREVILVDDASNYDFLQRPLEEFLRNLGDNRVRLVRQPRRDGLVWARIVGARHATAEVLVFLDAHVEVNIKWLEPLLDGIKQNKKSIAVPTIDDITPQNLSYIPWTEKIQGGFKWTLDFEWKLPVDAIKGNSSHSTMPVHSPTTIGCALAIDRNYFFESGAYDTGMHIWGGENLEISFRAWMCGGGIYVYPCSRVGHIFRRYLPYSFPAAFGSYDVVNRNLQRVADVWMDGYSKYYYASSKRRFKMRQSEEASLRKRKLLRRKLRCKDFSWYLENVIPDLPLPRGEPMFHGQLQNIASKKCLHYNIKKTPSFTMETCRTYVNDNTFSLTKNTSLMTQNGDCLARDKRSGNLVSAKCFLQQMGAISWNFDTSNNLQLQRLMGVGLASKRPFGQLVLTRMNTTICLASTRGFSEAFFMDCHPHALEQFWYFTYEFKFEFASDLGRLL